LADTKDTDEALNEPPARKVAGAKRHGFFPLPTEMAGKRFYQKHRFLGFNAILESSCCMSFNSEIVEILAFRGLDLGMGVSWVASLD
jgi:hypothetical protein